MPWTAKLDQVISAVETLQTQKDKLKGLVRYSRKELKRSKRKLKEISLESLNKNDKIEELNRTIGNLKEKIKLQDDKLKYYKRQEMEISLVKSFKSNVSDDLNMKLINQNQDILDRFYKEEERVRELDDANDKLADDLKKARNKVSRLKGEMRNLRMAKEKEPKRDSEVRDLKAEIMLLNNIKERLEDDEQKLKEKMQILRIEKDTYERKLNELIDEHNTSVEQYEKQIVSMRRALNLDNSSRQKENDNLKKIFESSISVSGDEVNKLKQSLINKRILESENQTLKAENSQLKLEMLNIKQKYMTLINKYTILKRRVRQGRLLIPVK